VEKIDVMREGEDIEPFPEERSGTKATLTWAPKNRGGGDLSVEQGKLTERGER